MITVWLSQTDKKVETYPVISIWSRCKCLVLRNSEQLAAAKVEWPEWVKVFWLIMIMNSDCSNWL